MRYDVFRIILKFSLEKLLPTANLTGQLVIDHYVYNIVIFGLLYRPVYYFVGDMYRNGMSGRLSGIVSHWVLRFFLVFIISHILALFINFVPGVKEALKTTFVIICFYAYYYEK